MRIEVKTGKDIKRVSGERATYYTGLPGEDDAFILGNKQKKRIFC